MWVLHPALPSLIKNVPKPPGQAGQQEGRPWAHDIDTFSSHKGMASLGAASMRR